MNSNRKVIKIICAITLSFFAIIFSVNMCFANDNYKRSILLIDSYPYGNKWNNYNLEKIKDKLKENHNLLLLTESVDSEKINNKEYIEAIKGNYEYNKKDLYLIIACDNNSFKFMEKYGDKIFGNTPTILLNKFNSDFIYDMLSNSYSKNDSSYLIPKAYIWNSVMITIVLLVLIIVMLVNSIEKRKEIEKALKENEENIRSIMNATPDIICIKDGNGRYIEINEAYKKFLNLKNLNYKGKHDLDLMKIIPKYKEYIMKFIESDKKAWESRAVWRGEEKFITKEGYCKIFDVIKVPIIDNEGTKKGLGVIGRDITERKINEELKMKVDENNRLLEKAKEYDKAKTEFFANVSHELRTPLNVMLSSLQLIQLYIENGSIIDKGIDLGKKIAVLRQNSLRVLKLINNLIDITKIDAGFYEAYLQNCNIVNLIEETTLSVAEYIESKGIKLIFDTDVEEKIIACDPEKIERIMFNLLSNATKFTPQGGLIEVNLYNKERNIIISVKDTGIGIPKDKQELIFERFRQVDRELAKNYEGSGIGLSLVKSLVEIHKGTIEVKSEYGKGSEFIISIPVTKISEEKSVQDISEISKDMMRVEFSDLAIN
ncbi:PAS domain-containing sensor histidine kinase [Clostridium tetanomorphum]|uniref:histidine kinase n=1 Tax=Clostridium tetanomorphum TaxID=1553 RepID=A0A923EDM7_CLOTT|nr:PAS domain-containing sensor histidine kinase [Clostridium tetanomorphum]MBC2400191.1 PAS domain-containing sensor histidine kinase [Clostridium tetanomorphum]NRZ98645.1 PAS domain S-box-containing protein [Clostridium tetanomorphum]